MIFGKKRVPGSASQIAWAILVGPQESKLLQSCSPRARESGSECRSLTEQPISLSQVAIHAICPTSGPVTGTPIGRGPGASSAASKAAGKSKKKARLNQE